mgnify:CR=1 FL=1
MHMVTNQFNMQFIFTIMLKNHGKPKKIKDALRKSEKPNEDQDHPRKSMKFKDSQRKSKTIKNNPRKSKNITDNQKNKITEKDISLNLMTNKIPDPDLVIRTSDPIRHIEQPKPIKTLPIKRV